MIEKAGTILINGNKIGLVYRDNYDDYTFPKGHREEGESFLECAIRETNEETKRDVVLLMEEPLYVEYYTNRAGEKCVCTYYLVRDNGKSNNDSTDTHDLVWTPFDQVEEILTHKSLKKLWNNIKDKVEPYLED